MNSGHILDAELTELADELDTRWESVRKGKGRKDVS